jgi:hypothetical protein
VIGVELETAGKGTNRDPGVRLDLRPVRVAADRSIPCWRERTAEQPRATVGAGKTAGRLDPPEQEEARRHVCLPKRGRESREVVLVPSPSFPLRQV